MLTFDVFAVVGKEWDSLFVLPQGEQQTGFCSLDGEVCELIGTVCAENQNDAHSRACLEYC